MSATRSRRGFTLLEVMIASVLLGIIGAGGYALFAATQRFTFSSLHRLDALNYGRAAQERMAAAAYDQLAGYTPAAGTPPGWQGGQAIAQLVDPLGVGADYVQVTVTTTRTE